MGFVFRIGAYDLLDRLETISINDADTGDIKTTTYTFYNSYDRKTELVDLTQGGTTTNLKNRTFQYDETYWLQTITDENSGDNIVYAYDNNGNTLSKVDNTQPTPEVLTFAYNSRNRLVQTQRGPPGSEQNLGTYDYNYAGMRIRHLGSDRGDVEYIYDGQSILSEVQNNTSNLLAHYNYADRLLSLTTPADTQFYHFAGLGTTANLSDSDGNIEVSYRTDAYGEITHQEGSSVNRQVFTGHEHDTETGLIYMKARYYDPDVGRFMTQDTYLGEPGTPPSLHRYVYAYGNPTGYVDWQGNFVVTDMIANALSDFSKNQSGFAKNLLSRRDGTVINDSTMLLGAMAVKFTSSLTDLAALGARAVDVSVDQKLSMLGDREILGQNSYQRTQKRIDAIDAAADNVNAYVGEHGIVGASKNLGMNAYLGISSVVDKLASGDDDAWTDLGAGGVETLVGGWITKTRYLTKLDGKPELTDENYDGSINGSNQDDNLSDSAARCPCCFVADTPVLTKDGLKPIQDIELGELVASKDDDTGELAWKPVTTLFENDDDRLTYRLTLIDEQGRVEIYELTDNHPFFVEGQGWVESIDLQPGMLIPQYDGGMLQVVSLEALDESPVTYNFEVADFHTYFVGELGAWVHNECGCARYKKSIKRKADNLKSQGYQDHHTISDKNQHTKDHELLTLAGSKKIKIEGRMAHEILQTRKNKILLPEEDYMHPTRSIHKGKHLDKVSENIAAQMTEVVEYGRRNDFTQDQYKAALEQIMAGERIELKEGTRALNKNRRPWAEEN